MRRCTLYLQPGRAIPRGVGFDGGREKLVKSKPRSLSSQTIPVKLISTQAQESAFVRVQSPANCPAALERAPNWERTLISCCGRGRSYPVWLSNVLDTVAPRHWPLLDTTPAVCRSPSLIADLVTRYVGLRAQENRSGCRISMPPQSPPRPMTKPIRVPAILKPTDSDPWYPVPGQTAGHHPNGLPSPRCLE